MGKDQVVDLEHVVHYHWIFLIVIALLIVAGLCFLNIPQFLLFL